MNQFSQKPANSKRRKPVFLFASVKQSVKKERSAGIRKNEPRGKARNSERNSAGNDGRKSGFGFNIPSAANLAVIAGIIVFAMIALRFEGFEMKSPDGYIFDPAADVNTAQHSIQYAETGIIAMGKAVKDTRTGIVITSNAVPKTETQEQIKETPGETSNHITASIPKGVDQSKNDLIITFKWQQYKVKKGDSVSSIAKRFGVSIGAIIASNEIRNARALQEGAMLRIPNVDGIPYSVKNGDTLSGISASFKVPLEVILDVNDIKTDKIKTGETIFIPGARMNDMDLRMSLGDLFTYPIHNRYITSGFGIRKVNGQLHFHTGIDFRANTGTPVTASLDGIVSVTGENWMYGKHIIISHSNGYKTLYAHLNSFSVKQGERVIQGKKIAESGNTGYSTGAHLHFAVFDKNGKYVNPLELLR
ncbi:MAG: M23 family metallopeptidase [Treponema sp.]|nr:M23 family metallopeptidase [Treponema sp.]